MYIYPWVQSIKTWIGIQKIIRVSYYAPKQLYRDFIFENVSWKHTPLTTTTTTTKKIFNLIYGKGATEIKLRMHFQSIMFPLSAAFFMYFLSEPCARKEYRCGVAAAGASWTFTGPALYSPI